MLMTRLYLPAFRLSKEYMPAESVAPIVASSSPGPCRSSGNPGNSSAGSPSVYMLSTLTSSAKSMPLSDAVVVCSPPKSTISAVSSPRSSTSTDVTAKV